MIRMHRFTTRNRTALGLAILAACLVFATLAAAQSASGVVDFPKPDAAKQDAPRADETKPAAKADAGSETAKTSSPTDPKARKTYDQAIDWEKHKFWNEAMEDFRKANRQDGGHCWDCLRRAYTLAVKVDAYKDAAAITLEMLPLAETDSDKGNVHYRLAMCLQDQGIKEKKDESLKESSEEFKNALALDPNIASAHFHWGVTLARLHQDDAAHAQFAAFLDEDHKNPSLHERAERFLDRIDLARATMAPPFMATTLDGQHISMDGLAGKVVLIDFWATWCGPCVNALPNIQHLARKFDGQPLVIVSVSLDNDEAKWKSFVDKNRMTWMQVRDGGFNGQVSKKFGVTAIPATFSIDADGVLEDQHVGDADIEGKLKKMVAHAAQMGERKPAPAVSEVPAASGN